MGVLPSLRVLDEFGAVFGFQPGRAWEDDAAVAEGAVDRVLVLGDIHNSAGVFAAALRAAAEAGCDALVQVGDFWLQDASWAGWDPRTRCFETLWGELMWLAVESPIPVIVIDGNHEVWPCLTRYLARADTAEAQAAGRPLHLGGSLWWADRGSTWTWRGARCGALGGAVSPDRWLPALAEERWGDEEAPTGGDLARLADNAAGSLDVLFCHDAPWGVRGLRSGLPWQIPDPIAAQADDVRRLLRAAVDRTEPTVVFHGHWHQHNHDRLTDTDSEVFGLAADGRPGCTAVLDTAARRAAYLAPRDELRA